MVDDTDQSVFYCYVPQSSPSHMLRDGQLLRKTDGPIVLASGIVKPLELNAEHHGRPFYLELLGG